MKAINLYNMVADGTPAKKIKYRSYEFEYDKELHDYYCSASCSYGWLFDTLKDLNEEVEIVEEYKEDKKEEIKNVEKIVVKVDGESTYIDEADYLLPETKIVIEKLNEVIERLNEVIESEEDSTND